MKQTKINAEIVAHSLSLQKDELISVLCTFPRIILAEVNTHRMLSKNTSSSRAIPFNKMVEAIEANPFIPIAWQKDHKGMQGTEYITDNYKISLCQANWLQARNYAIKQAIRLNTTDKQWDESNVEGTEVTKQLCNRLLEPFMWTTMLITGSREGWDNFFKLRLPEYHLENIPTVNEDLSLNSKTLTLVGKSKKELLKQINEIDNDSYVGFKTIINNYSDLNWLKINKGQAEIHMMALAECIWDAVNESTPKQLKPNQWHIPFKNKINHGLLRDYFYKIENNSDPAKSAYERVMIKISTAMAAHTSYTTVGSEPVKSYEKWIELHDKLIAYDPPHSSPMEHCARAMNEEEFNTFHKGKLTDLSSTMEGFHPTYNKDKGWCYNLKGFIPYRYFIDNKLKI